jgi:hypothetical protein
MFTSSETIRRKDHGLMFRLEGQLLIWRTAWIIVQALNLASVPTQGDVVEAGNGESLASISRREKAAFWVLSGNRNCNFQGTAATHLSIASKSNL